MLDIYVREWTVWDSLSRRLIPGPGQIAGRRLIECCLCNLQLSLFLSAEDIVKCCGWRRAYPDGLSGGFDVSVLKFNALDDEFNEFVICTRKLVSERSPRTG